jgi:hypothetical protein
MSRLVMIVAVATVLGCADGPLAEPPPAETGAGASTGCGKCDGVAPDAALLQLSLAVPGEAAVARLYADALRDDGALDDAEAAWLGAFVRREGSASDRLRGFLEHVARAERTTPAARATLEEALAVERPGDVPLRNEVYSLTPGTQPFLFDDTLVVHGAGRVDGDTGLVSHSRGYAAKRDGVLFRRHGSLAPAHPLVERSGALERLRAQGPDEALDRAARVAGLELDAWNTFSALARDPNYYDPSDETPFWAGICQGWTHNALDNRLSLLVDVPGAEGERGLWIFGEWISRADLGNALMGASYSLGIADSVTIDSFVTPAALVKALAQHVLRSGVGLRVDIWSDERNDSGTYDPQVWNQPIISGGLDFQAVSAATAEAVRAHAAATSRWGTPPADDAAVWLVRAHAVWGVEANDAWEGEPLFGESEWNMYLVTDADGAVRQGFLAPDLVDAGVGPLPVVDSDGLPDYLAVPTHALTDAAFAGTTHRLLDSGSPEGQRFRFLVGTVLARGVPAATRAAFERDVEAGVPASTLKARYPGIANAYAPDDWQRSLAPRLGAAADFGAAWPGAGGPN